MDSNLMDIPEGAAYIRLSPHTVRLWIYQKRLPCVRLGRRVLLKRGDLDRLVEQGYRPAVNAK